MPRRRLAAEPFDVSVSSIQIRPLVGSIIRLIMRSEVVLPQPDGPTRTVIWPDGAGKLRSSTAIAPPPEYFFVTDSKRIMQRSPGPVGRVVGGLNGVDLMIL